MTDARFEDAGNDAPLRLKALSNEDLTVISALVQDAVFPGSEMSWRAAQRRFALLLNRFRWEDADDETRRGKDFERVQSVLVIDDVLKVRSQGIERRDPDTVFSLLAVEFEPGEDGTGKVIMTLSGDGAIALEVEALDVTLRDVTRPYLAPSRRAPSHP